MAFATLLASCATEKVDRDAQITSGWPVERLYTEANNELTGKNYVRSIKLYDILLGRFPYGKFAEQALLDKAYAYYKYEEKEKALETINEFQKLYPKHPQMDYVLYLKGMVEFNQRNESFLDKLSEQDWSERDPDSAKQALKAYSELVEKYPNSQYFADATQKMNSLIEALGAHELAVARYYYRMGAYIAASNRAQQVLNDYKNTSNVEEALALIMSSQEKLGQGQLAQDARHLLELNFPQSSYLSKGGWYDRKELTPWQATRKGLQRATKWLNPKSHSE